MKQLDVKFWKRKPGILYEENPYDEVFNDFFKGFSKKEEKIMNIYDKDGKRFYELQVPGWSSQELDVSFNYEDNSINVEGKRNIKVEDEDKEKNWIRSEFRKESFFVTKHIEEYLDPETIKLSLQNGILTICIEGKKNIEKNRKKISFE